MGRARTAFAPPVKSDHREVAGVAFYHLKLSGTIHVAQHFVVPEGAVAIVTLHGHVNGTWAGMRDSCAARYVAMASISAAEPDIPQLSQVQRGV